MKQIILKKGQISLEEVPTPICSENNVLIQNYYSLISAGTENTTINFSKANIIKKTLNYPDKIAKGFQILKRKGVTETFKLTKNFLEFPSALGYSCAGKVIAIGDNIKDIKRGDMVAGSGAQYANHAEIVSIPRNLLVKIPEELNIKTACSASVGAIALHGVRQLEPQLGETIVVIGLGLIGNLVAQILKANGNKVIGIDINNLRLKKAEELGIDFVFNSTNTNLTQKILKITNNIGVDGVIIAASVNNSTLINESLDFTRKRGRVVVLGVVGLNIQRNR